MANTIDWGQGAVNNTNNWGKGKTNATNNWGAIYDSTAAGETNITGSGGGTPFTNTYSMSFDGVDEYFTGASTFSELDGLNKMTISMWVKPTSLSVARVLFHTPRNTTSSNSQILLFLRTDGTLDFSMNITSYYGRSVSGAITAGVWNHILIGVDLATAGNIQMFVNGSDVLSVQNMGSRVSFDTSTGAFYIGEEANGYLNPFLGEIDEVAMWVNSDQSANVSDIYNGGVPFDLSTLATAPDHWWRMGDNDTWGGSQWTLTDNIGSYDLNSVNMEEADRLPISPNSYTQNSFSFDGVDERFYVGTSSLGITNAITVSAWVKIPTTNTGGPSNRQQIICEDTTTAGQRNWNLLWRGTGFNYFQWVVWHTDLSATSITSTGVTPNDGQWHHLLATYDGTTNANGIKLYIDGVLNAQGTAGSTGINSFTSTEPTIGKLTTSNDRYFEGNIDEVAIWNSDQNTNASTIYNSGAPTDLTSLSPLSWWRMGENATWNGSIWTLTDQGSGGNNATSVNMEEADKTGDQAYVI